MLDLNAPLPQHIAIIMDGNRRWARAHGLEMIKGHRKVAQDVIEELVDRCIELGIPYLTLWAFSTENWHRSQEEVSGLMQLFREVFDTQSSSLHKKGVRIETIGDLSKFDPDIRKNVEGWVKETKNNQKITVVFALNYGGRDEIVRAVQKIEQARGEVSEQTISHNLDTRQFPDPDLIIRPGGEKRLSGFLAWQSVYAELYFTDILMPDFTTSQLDQALEDFQHRQRRYGK